MSMFKEKHVFDILVILCLGTSLHVELKGAVNLPSASSKSSGKCSAQEAEAKRKAFEAAKAQTVR